MWPFLKQMFYFTLEILEIMRIIIFGLIQLLMKNSSDLAQSQEIVPEEIESELYIRESLICESTSLEDNHYVAHMRMIDIEEEWIRKAKQMEELRLSHGLSTYFYQVLKWDEDDHLVWEAVEKDTHKKSDLSSSQVNSKGGTKFNQWKLKKSLSWVNETPNGKEPGRFAEIIAVYRYDTHN